MELVVAELGEERDQFPKSFLAWSIAQKLFPRFGVRERNLCHQKLREAKHRSPHAKPEPPYQGLESSASSKDPDELRYAPDG
ncbi:hypothetical protein D3C87_1732400 [compost metagenome]